MRRVSGWLAWWIGLFWLWLLFVGEWNRIELVAAAIMATIAATAAEIVRSRRLLRYRVQWIWIRRAASVPRQILVDFGIVTLALFRQLVLRRPVEGVFRANEFPAGADDLVSAGRRAWVTVAATYSPNAYVVDIDCDRKLVLLHDLVPSRDSESPA